MIAAVRELKSKSHADEPSDSEDPTKRINLIQKIMAQNSVQSEILKKYYFSKIAHSPKTARTTSLNVIESNSYNPEETAWKPKVSLIKTTANRDAFKRPDPHAYKIYQHYKGFFNADKHLQPLPRTSYGR